MTNNQIADKIILLQMDIESSIDDSDEMAGKRLRLARFIADHHKQITAALYAADRSEK